MDTRIASILMADIEALTSKIIDCMDDGDVRRTLIAGQLATCRHLLSAGMHGVNDEQTESDDELVEQPARPPRDLRREMAGPLPPAIVGETWERLPSGGHDVKPARQRRKSAGPDRPARRRAAPFREVPAPAIGHYEEIAGEPGDECMHCGGPYEAHPIDRALPRKDDMVARVLCDQTRAWVYSRASQNGV